MEPRIRLIFVGIVAILLGLAIAYPLYASNVVMYKNTDDYLGVDVVYAYFSTQAVSGNIAGLYSSTGQDYGSFFVVLNVTNYSNNSVTVNMFRTSAGEQIEVTYTPESTGFSTGSKGLFFWHCKTDIEHHDVFSNNFDLTWAPYESRLVALSGITKFYGDLHVLQSGTFHISGQVAGIIGDNSLNTIKGGAAKLIHVKQFGNEYLYNDLVGENEMLQEMDHNGLIVQIVPRS